MLKHHFHYGVWPFSLCGLQVAPFPLFNFEYWGENTVLLIINLSSEPSKNNGS